MEMMDEGKVLESIRSENKPVTMTRLEEKLGVRTSGDFAVLSRILGILEDKSLLFRTQDNRYITAEQKGYVIGRIHVTVQSVGFVDTENGSVRIEKEDLNGAMNGDEVVAGENRVLSVLKRAASEVTGTFTAKGKRLVCVLNDPRTEAMRHVLHFPKELSPKAGMSVVMKIVDYGPPAHLEYVRTLGDARDPETACEALLIDCGVRTQYPEEVLQEAEAMPRAVEDISGRTDLRNEMTVTIDGDDSKDFDDAVSVSRMPEGWRLKVSIADVSWYVREGSALDREAFLRGCSVYTPVRTEGMLPVQLSNGICSLNPGVDRLTLTCDMVIAEDGHTESYTVYPSVIRSNERMTYRNVNAVLDGNPEICGRYERYVPFLQELAACADAIRTHRHDKGAIDFNVPEAEIEVNARGYAVNVKEQERGHAERIIEDCMIAANVCVAQLMRTNGIPAVYRVHGEPEYKRLESFRRISALFGQPFNAKGNVQQKDLQAYLESVEGSANETVIAQQLLQCMAKAYYSESGTGHYGLAEEDYLHFTSPIRRYPDLLVHRMLRKHLFEKNSDPMDAAVCAEAAVQSSERERISVDAERKCDAVKSAEYMLSQKGRKFRGVICSVNRSGMYVRLPNTVEGLVSMKSLEDDYYEFDEMNRAITGRRTHRTFRLGEEIEVLVADASVEKGTVDFTIEQKPAARRPERGKRQDMRRGGARRGRKNGRKEYRR